MLTKIIKWNDMVKEDVEDFYEFHFGLLFYSHAFHSHDICQDFGKKRNGRIVSNSLILREVICCYKRLWEFFFTKPICYKDVFVNSFCSPTFANSLVVERVLRLLFKWLSNLELIPSSLRQNNNRNIFKIQCIVFDHLRTLTTS